MKKTIKCDACNGSGRISGQICVTCSGYGQIVERTDESTGQVRRTKVLNE